MQDRMAALEINLLPWRKRLLLKRLVVLLSSLALALSVYGSAMLVNRQPSDAGLSALPAAPDSFPATQEILSVWAQLDAALVRLELLQENAQQRSQHWLVMAQLQSILQHFVEPAAPLWIRQFLWQHGIVTIDLRVASLSEMSVVRSHLQGGVLRLGVVDVVRDGQQLLFSMQAIEPRLGEITADD